MNALTETEGLTLLLIFGVVMVLYVWTKRHTEDHLDGFLVADRMVGLWRGAFSTAVSWIWAPAIFICSLQSYTKGLAGIFWFTVPNIICFFLFAPFAVRIRKLFNDGYTLPELVAARFDSRRTHIAFLVIFFGYQFSAVIINALAGGMLLHAVSGIEVNVAIISMTGIALAYSILAGMKASVDTDVIQMAMILTFSLLIVPLCITNAGGADVISSGFAGITGEFGNMLHPGVAFAMGIPLTVSLLSGPFGDQMFYQRAFSFKRETIGRSFVLAGILFGLVPIILSLLGFIGVSLVAKGVIEVSNPEMVAPTVVAYLLPKWALYVFCLMAFAGLCSTIDSALCAGSSLSVVDIYSRYLNKDAKEATLLRITRMSMVGLAVAGTAVALLKPKLLWVFLIQGSLVAAGLIPTVLAFCWSRLNADGAFYGIVFALIIGLPLSVYANVTESEQLIVFSAVLPVIVSLLVCVAFGYVNKEKPFNFSKLT